MPMNPNPAPFQPQRTGGEAPFVDIPVSVSVPAHMAERHRAQYEELARLQRQELLQLAHQPSYGSSNQGSSSNRYGSSQQGGFGRSFSGHENNGMYLGVGEQDRPSPGSPGSQGQARFQHGMNAQDGGFGAIDGLYQDVKKRRVDPVYDASEWALRDCCEADTGELTIVVRRHGPPFGRACRDVPTGSCAVSRSRLGIASNAKPSDIRQFPRCGNGLVAVRREPL